jgi:hypothetical protein
MEPTIFDDDRLLDGASAPHRETPEARNKGRAVAQLLRHRRLVHRVGDYEVHTTLDTERAWRYRCSVRRRGRELRRDFFPIVVDRTQPPRDAAMAADERRIEFAMEAVDMHFARCGALQHYLKWNAGPSSPRWPAYRLLPLALAIGAMALLAFWSWRPLHPVDLWSLGQAKVWAALAPIRDYFAHPDPAPTPPLPRPVQWERTRVSYTLPAGRRFAVLLPALQHVPEDLPVDIAVEASSPLPSWLHFSRDTLVLSGTAPAHDVDRTVQLTLRATPQHGPPSLLQVSLSIAAPRHGPAPTPQPSSGVAVDDAPSGKDCLLQILKNEPC